MKKILAILIVCILIISGCSFRCVRNLCINGIGFSGAIERLDADKKIELYVKEVSELSGSNSSLITVGHQFGNYQAYPKFPNDIQNYSFEAAEEMKKGFTELRLKGVEFDIQLGPEKQNVYIIHENIRDVYKDYDDVPDDLNNFLSKNSLEKLVRDFIKKGFYKDKYLYIELKAKKAYSLDEKGEEKETIDKALKIIGEIVDENLNKNLRGNIRKHIGFISFNYLTLKRVIELSYRNNNIKKHKLYYIVGPNELLKIIFSCSLCPEISTSKNLFVKEEQNESYATIWCWMNNNNELAGIWFSPNHIKNVVSELNKLNDRRVNKGLQPFEYFLSTYQKNKNDFLSVLKKDKDIQSNEYFYKNIKGLIFDIKK